MKSFIRFFLLVTGFGAMLTACERVMDLPYYGPGTATVLSASSPTIATTAADSTKTVLTLNWTSPNYATDSNNVKYILQIDSAGRNFSKAVTRELKGTRQVSFTGNELNNMLLNFGFAIGSPVTLNARVISSYANNNEMYNSNVLNVSITGFSEPSVLTSSATTVTGTLATASQTAVTFNWTPSFASYSGVVTYSLQFDSANKNFSSPQEIAVGATMYTKQLTQKEINEAAISEGITAGATGKLDYRVKAVTALGAIVYSNVIPITVNTYIPLINYQFPKALWVAGNFQNWDPGSAPKIVDPAATGTTGNNYEGYINFNNASPEFKLVKGNNWGAGDFGDAGGGKLSNGGNNLKLTQGAGMYLLKANTQAMTWSAIKINTWGIIGDATPGGWGSSTPMTLNANGTYTLTANLVGGKELKFRANDDWGINLGDNKAGGGPDGIPEYNGDNIAIAASGSYLITLDLSSGGNYKYTLKKL